ncbi:hypothetical protein GCM10027259_04790 [Micromonospora palomenae]
MALAAAVNVCRRVSRGQGRFRSSLVMGNLSSGGAYAPAVAREGLPTAALASTAAGDQWYGRCRGKVRRYAGW